jgi:hypothetical protein
MSSARLRLTLCEAVFVPYVTGMESSYTFCDLTRRSASREGPMVPALQGLGLTVGRTSAVGDRASDRRLRPPWRKAETQTEADLLRHL